MLTENAGHLVGSLTAYTAMELENTDYILQMVFWW